MSEYSSGSDDPANKRRTALKTRIITFAVIAVNIAVLFAVYRDPDLLLFVLLIALSGFFSGIEIAYFSLSPGRVRSMVRKKLKHATRVERLKNKPQRLLVTILIGNNLVNILAAAIATKVSLEIFGSLGVGIATGIVTVLVLVFGEIAPKSLAQNHAETVSRWSAPVIIVMEIILWPIVSLFENINRLIQKMFPQTRRKHQVSEEDIRSMMHLGVEEGTVERHEREFIDRLFRFDDAPVSSIMRPMKDVVMLDGNKSIDKVVDFVAGSDYSRFPVYEKSRRNIVGIIHLKDIMRARQLKKGEGPVKSIASEIFRVSSNELLDDVFHSMQRKRRHFCLVENKKGEPLGIATLEDVIEELLGEIHDEFDIDKVKKI